ncbi:MAG: hypothetical protein K2O99_09285, partial [Lachnospiraceae bacterium]|nr:hypothetical protein [Lachnospiraceae bacterium]
MEIRNDDIRERVNIREIYRYLGYGAGKPNDSVYSMIVEVLGQLSQTVQPRYVYRVYACSVSETGVTL